MSFSVLCSVVPARVSLSKRERSPFLIMMDKKRSMPCYERQYHLHWPLFICHHRSLSILKIILLVLKTPDLLYIFQALSVVIVSFLVTHGKVILNFLRGVRFQGSSAYS